MIVSRKLLLTFCWKSKCFSPDWIISRDFLLWPKSFHKGVCVCVCVFMHTVHWWYIVGIKITYPFIVLIGHYLGWQGFHFCGADMRTSSVSGGHFFLRLLLKYRKLVLIPSLFDTKWGYSLGLLDWAVGIIKTKAVCHCTDFFLGLNK